MTFAPIKPAFSPPPVAPIKVGSGPTGPELGSSIRTSKMASGFLNSRAPGRTDALSLNVRNGSYVVPADVVSFHGEGNSMAGAAAMDKTFHQGPYNTSAPRIPSMTKPIMPKVQPLSFISGRKRDAGGPIGSFESNPIFGSMQKLQVPQLSGPGGYTSPPNASTPPGAVMMAMQQMAGGGSIDGGVPVRAAGGEYIVEPQTVARLGNGDSEKGFALLDRFVLASRRNHISTLQHLPGPRKD